MRDALLLMTAAAMLPLVFVRPHIGVLLWCWSAMLIPNAYVYGFAAAIRYNLVFAIVTIVAMVFSREPKRLRLNSTLVLLTILVGLGFVSTLFGVGSTEDSWSELDKLTKIVALAYVVTILFNSETRIRALLFAIALSMGFHGVLEGAKFVLSGGGHRVWGPGTSIISDNNHFALAMIMVIPLICYLYTRTQHYWVRLALMGAIFLDVMAVVGTFSRGGFLGILALAVWMFLTSRNKAKGLFLVVPAVLLALSFAPATWFDRIGTIETADQDSSFMGRVVAWKINTLLALDHPLIGAGFRGTQEMPVWAYYSQRFATLDFIDTPPPDPVAAHAAHSIYFQVLGDMGFTGLAVYLVLLCVAWRNASATIKLARGDPALKWVLDLARMLQYALIPYFVSGAALNMAYFDLAYVVFALLALLRNHAAERSAERPRENPATIRAHAAAA